MWKSIVGYEGIYEVSDTGDVRSLVRVVKRGSGQRKVKGRLLDQYLTKLDYWSVCLSKNGKQKSINVRQLVAYTFLGPCPDGCVIYSKNKCPQNNRLDNLVDRR